jgi:hypothetical protein
LLAVDLVDENFDEVGETLTLYLVHTHDTNSIDLVKSVDVGMYRFAKVTVTRVENNTFAVTSITRATGEFVNAGQLKTIAGDATVGTETYQVRPVDADEAPDALRIISQTLGEPDANGARQPIAQVALDWADPTSVINIGGNTDADADVLEGLKDGVIWTYDAAGNGTPIYFQAPVNGKLALPDTGTATGDDATIVIYVGQGANPAVPDVPENGWSLMAMTKSDWDALSADAKANLHQVGTVSAPDTANNNARTFTPVAEAATATATVQESVSGTPQSVILTAAHLRAVD